MEKAMKEELLSMLDALVKGHEYAWNTLKDDDDFWSACDKMKKFIENQPEEDEGRLVADIVWRTDGADDEEDAAGLPKETYIPAGIHEDDIAGYLFEKYKRSVYSFRISKTGRNDIPTFRVSTPKGPIEARVSQDEEYPGIALVYAGKKSGEPGVIMEYVSEDDEEYPGQVVLKVWSRERPESDPSPVLPMSRDVY